MCFPQKLKIRTTRDYKWGGDIIINRPIVKSFRKIPGTDKGYDIDVRDFLRANGNAIIDEELAAIRSFADTIKIADIVNIEEAEADLKREEKGGFKKQLKYFTGSEFFLSKKPGSFDFRVKLIMSYLRESFVYRKKRKDPWLFPEETLSLRIGDCEDFAFLVASILISSGISSYNVRVALGTVQFYRNDKKVEKPKGHAWVMYKQENSEWKIIEPTLLAISDNHSQSSTKVPVSSSTTIQSSVAEIEYIPQFVFNDDHLWITDVDDKKSNYGQKQLKDSFFKIRKRWNKLSPSFHGEIHKSILIEAVKDPVLRQKLGDKIKPFLFFGDLVDEVDNPMLNKYTPLEHFDNGYIKRSWETVEKNLSIYKANQEDVFPLCKALHAVADFYAHSTYVHFAKPDAQGELPIFDVSSVDTLNNDVNYLTDDIFRDKWKKFSLNKKVYTNPDRNIAIESWKGTLISGRYAQAGEQKERGGTFIDRSIEALLSIPEDLINDKGDVFSMRGALPHHNEIAVDQNELSKFHLLYDEAQYKDQLEKRERLAKKHIEQIVSTL